MADKIIRVLAKDAPVKASAITAKEMVERARQIHKTLPVATAALGRSLMAASMMGNQLKEKDGSVTLRIKGGGPLGGITVVSDSQGNARGYVVNPLVDLPLKGPAKLDVGSAVGRDGSLTVIKDLCMKEPYVGTVPLVSGEIAEDITSYFAESEQIPTACALGVLVDVDQSVQCAGGYLIQLLPGADDAAISAIEQGIARVGPVTEALRGGLSARELVEQVLSEFQLEVLSEEPVEYRCYCSRERVTRALISMGREELNSLIRRASTFEGEASTALEFAAEAWRKQREMQKKNPEENLKIRMSEKEDIPESTGISEASEDERKFILNTGEIVAYLVRARLAGEDPGKLAYGFHRALADEILVACEEAERQTGIRKVALSGGVFQNRLLLELVDDGLTEMGFKVLKHSLIPPNDGGIALGQAVYGMAYVQRHR